jgi:hypothetical protein
MQRTTSSLSHGHRRLLSGGTEEKFSRLLRFVTYGSWIGARGGMNSKGELNRGNGVQEISPSRYWLSQWELDMNAEETVALIGGGHAFGKTHGACMINASDFPVRVLPLTCW